MSEKNFSHVCGACRAPALLTQRKRAVLDTAILMASSVVGAVIFFNLFDPNRISPLYTGLIGALLGFVGAYLSIAYMIRKRVKTCPSCHAERLIPVASPEGSRIMKELGFVES